MFIGVIAGGLFGGQYRSAEMCVIKWGDNIDQLKIGEPDYDETLPPDSTTSKWIETSGPTQGFVDKDENLYISSYDFSQFKAFKNTGDLIFNYSADDSILLGRYLSKHIVNKFYVDSLGKIFIQLFPPYPALLIVDRLANQIDSISLENVYPTYHIGNFWWGSKDIISIMYSNYTQAIFITYKGDRIIPGGSLMWPVSEEYYYARHVDSTRLRFYKCIHPDTDEVFEYVDTNSISLDSLIFGSSFLGVDDSLYQYVMVGWGSKNRPSVLIYDMKYQLAYKIIPPIYSNKYFRRMGYCVRPDGTVYEFRCLDDGLHVIKWSKQ